MRPRCGAASAGKKWCVSQVELERTAGEVRIFLQHQQQTRWPCPECGVDCPLYDHQPERRWRHLDTCQYRPILHAQPPRRHRQRHGPRGVRLTWAEAGSRFTALLEALVISWLRQASQSGGAEGKIVYDKFHIAQHLANALRHPASFSEAA